MKNDKNEIISRQRDFSGQFWSYYSPQGLSMPKTFYKYFEKKSILPDFKIENDD